MIKISFNQNADDLARREHIFAGTLVFHSATPESRTLCEFARTTIGHAFGGRDPEHAQESMTVEEFIAVVGPMKSLFTNAWATKEHVRAYLVAMGVDAENTYFDVPRLRVVPHSEYLTSGVSYAYKAHRDTWYSSPLAQVNWWLPVWDVTIERTMAFFPGYWSRPIANSSSDFDYGEWCRIGRAQAVSQVAQDTRNHPLPKAQVTADDEFRYAARAGDAVVFSAAQLHATAPNTSTCTRFSMDFRTVQVEDLRSGRGAPNIDGGARGSTLGDFLRVSDFSPLSL